ncbi:RNA ligase family protein [Bacillus cereus group sp. TH153LC]|uniref:RNA ligase family protein n=1 Tax=Bacillus cereus group sp. TH153LC TaxID=3018059 RepID=UPI0022E78E6B|nr:RNA ligase family protein [Bacillus cereus group sp. TH153LC]MDA1658845.1 RNA ligase family protein [Bacillus cereus group sp. TH153LC]
MEQKKYMDVVRLGHRSTVGVLNEGDHIVIQEKIDGANASFTGGEGVIRCFSRNKELDEENTLGGFYQFANSLNGYELIPGYMYFGEWLNPHKIKYENYEKQFFLFDIYDLNRGLYLPFSIVRCEASRLDLNLVPVFYEGVYQGFDHLQQFVGITNLGGKLGEVMTGEGVVVKNVSYLDRFGKQQFVKLVTDVFREVQQQKAPKDPSRKTEEQVFVDICLTKARVEKLLYKLVDEEVLDERFDITDMETILQNLGSRIFEDMMKEEKDLLPKEYEENQIRKAIGRGLAATVKSILLDREKEGIFSE